MSSLRRDWFSSESPTASQAGRVQIMCIVLCSHFQLWVREEPAGYSYKEDFMWIFGLGTKALCPALSLGIVSCVTLIHDDAHDYNEGFLLTFPFPQLWDTHPVLMLLWLMPRSYLWYHILSIRTYLPDGSGDRNRQIKLDERQKALVKQLGDAWKETSDVDTILLCISSTVVLSWG